jgi:hypothetical protein
VFINNILDIKQGILAIIIGTLFKDMRKKPNILKDITGTLGQRKPIDFCSDDDHSVLEDSSGRIKIKDATAA